MIRLNACLAIAALVFSASAFAQDLPSYDTEGTCRRDAACTSNSAEAALAYKACRIQEAESFFRVQSVWPLLSGALRKECLEELSYDSSYWKLMDCFDHKPRRQRRSAESLEEGLVAASRCAGK